MKAFVRLCIIMLSVFLVLAAVLDVVLIRQREKAVGVYRVEAKRLADEIADTGKYDLEKYPHITGVFTGDELYKSDEQYVIIEADGTLYRAEYVTDNTDTAFVCVNCVLAVMFLMMCAVFAYIWKNIIKIIQGFETKTSSQNLSEPFSRIHTRFTFSVMEKFINLKEFKNTILSMNNDDNKYLDYFIEELESYINEYPPE